MNNISLISVYNNDEKLNEMVESAKIQKNVNVEYILIDNSGQRFKSASEALNYGVSKATGEVIVFLHQDIVFLDSFQLENIYYFALNNKNVIFGSAGVKSKIENPKGTILSSMYGGESKNKIDTLKQPELCLTLDECLIACHTNCLRNLSFDEKICDGWHLYGADLCLQANLLENMKVMVVPMNIWHKSNGNADNAYLSTQNKLGKKYCKKYKIINTTNGYVYTNAIKRFLLNTYRVIRYRNLGYYG